MNSTKILILVFVGILATALMLMIIQLLLRKFNEQSETDFKLKSAYGIWFTGLFLAAALITARTITFFNEALDNIFKIGGPNLAMDIAKNASLYTGIGLIWFLLWYFVGKVCSAVIFGVRKEKEEMALNNVYFFLINGAIINGLIFSLSPVLEILFRWIMPDIPIPFYH